MERHCLICGAGSCSCLSVLPDGSTLAVIPPANSTFQNTESREYSRFEILMNETPYIPTARLYLDENGAVVGESDPNRRELLCVPGAAIPAHVARAHGLIEDVAEVAVKTVVETAPAPSTPGVPKAVAPRRNKAKLPAETK